METELSPLECIWLGCHSKRIYHLYSNVYRCANCRCKFNWTDEFTWEILQDGDLMARLPRKVWRIKDGGRGSI